MPLVWLVLERRVSVARAVFASWLCGTVFWVVNISWIAHSIGVHGGVPLWIAALLLLLLALYMGLYWTGFVLVGRWLTRGLLDRRWGAWLVPTLLAAIWVLFEIAREWMLTGFPWTPLGESLVRVPGALEASAWIGVRGLSFVVFFVNAALAQWVFGEGQGHQEQGRPGTQPLVKRPGGVVLASIAIAVLLFVSAWLRTSQLEARHADSIDSPLVVKIVQPNVPIGAPAEEAIENYNRLLRLSKCQSDELVVWPESAAFPRTWQRNSSLRQDVSDTLGGDCDLLFNTAWEQETATGAMGFWNTALLLSQAGSAEALDLQRYDKIHLVPYGEYVPLREVLPFVGQLARNVGEFQPGTEINLVQWRERVSIALSICFEVLFPKEVAARARAGATLLATLTNDAWFGDTAGPAQHLVAARFRAAETRLPLVFAATTGISAAVDGRGRVFEQLPLNSDGVITLDLKKDLRHSESPSVTPYARAPWVIDFVCVLIFALGLFASRFLTA